MECRDAPAERPRPSPGQALSRSLVALDQNGPIIALVELSQSSWLVGGMLPGIERQPCKKLELSPEPLLALLHAGRMRRSGPAALSRGLRLPSKPAATASGWRAGLRRVGFLRSRRRPCGMACHFPHDYHVRERCAHVIGGDVKTAPDPQDSAHRALPDGRP